MVQQDGLDESNAIFKREMDVVTRAHVERLSLWMDNWFLSPQKSRVLPLQERPKIRRIFEDLDCLPSLKRVVQPFTEGIDLCDAWAGTHRRLLFEKAGNNRSDFYIFDLGNNTTEQVGGTLLDHSVRGGLTYVQLTNTVYALGQTNHRKNEEFMNFCQRLGYEHQGFEHAGASLLKLSSFRNMSKCEWNSFDDTFPPLKDPSLECTSFRETIFCIFSPTDAVNAQSIGVFYNTSSKIGGWRLIPSPPITPPYHTYPIHGPLIPDLINERLLGVFSPGSTIYAYYPSNPNHPWDLVADNASYAPLLPAPEIVHNVLFFHGTRKRHYEIKAYDIEEKHNIEVSWSSHSPFGPADLFTFDELLFLHLGGNVLCLCTLAFDYDSKEPFVHFYPLQARRISSQELRLDSRSVHHIRCPGFKNLISCVPI